jgi:hypothetical protein
LDLEAAAGPAGAAPFTVRLPLAGLPEEAPGLFPIAAGATGAI